MSKAYRAEIATPVTVEEVFGGRYDGSFRVEATCPGCGNKVQHYMGHDEFGLSHRVCNELCGGDYEMARPSPVGLIGPAEHRWWEADRRPRRFGGLAGLGGVTGLAAWDLSAGEVA